MTESAPVKFPRSGGDPDCPFEFFERLRRERQVQGVVLPSGMTGWLVSGYTLTLHLLSDKRLGRILPDSPESNEHRKFRRTVSQLLTPEIVDDLQPLIKSRCDFLMEVAARNGGVDLVAGYALPAASAIFHELLGVDQQDREKILQLVLAIPPEEVRREDKIDSEIALEKARQYFMALADTRSLQPKRDLVSRLATGEECRKAEEIADIALKLFVAGFEPTANLISSSLLHLLNNPDLLLELQRRPNLADSVAQELARYDGPVYPGITRRVWSDIDVAGQHIRAGDLLVFPVSAAGRDAETFEDANVLKWDRMPSHLLTFGYGPHYCLGARLALMALTIAIRSFAERTSNVQIEDHSEVWNDRFVRGLLRLPIVLTRV
jgi:cytochrome P450